MNFTVVFDLAQYSFVSFDLIFIFVSYKLTVVREELEKMEAIVPFHKLRAFFLDSGGGQNFEIEVTEQECTEDILSLLMKLDLLLIGKILKNVQEKCFAQSKANNLCLSTGLPSVSVKFLGYKNLYT